jgi:CheY-like chemotaxis protein
MSERPATVLLIDDDPEDIRLMEEAFAEIEEIRFRFDWMPACVLVPVSEPGEAVAVLAEESVDVILMALTPPDGDGSQNLRRIQRAAPEVPVVVLAGHAEERAALRLVRQGAEDLLRKSELDCIPLARTIRCAIERGRFRAALRSRVFIDELTGLYSDGGFLNLGERYWRLAGRAGWLLRLYLIELAGLEPAGDAEGGEEHSLIMLLAGDALLSTFADPDVVGRVGWNRFAVLSAGDGGGNPSPESLRLRLAALSARSGGGGPLDIRVVLAEAKSGAGETFSSLIEAAQALLCENGRCAAGAAP